MTSTTIYDVFLCHATRDKSAVENLARKIKRRKLKPFLDKWHLVPGEPWQEALEAALNQSQTFAVFIGSGSLGPWQNKEMRDALEARVRDKSRRVIPVLLPGASMPDEKALPRFLQQLLWVDFREGLDDPEAFYRLICGIKGVSPKDLAAAPVTPRPVRQAATVIGDLFLEDKSAFFHRRVLAALEARLDESSNDLCVLGLPGSGTSTTLRRLVRRRPDVRVVDSRAFPRHEALKAVLPSDGVIAVLGHPGVAWLAKLQTLVDPKRVRIVTASAVAPALMEPVLMTPLDDDALVAMLGTDWKEWVRDVAWVTGRSPGAVRRLQSLGIKLDALSREEIQERIWGEAELAEGAEALADLDPRARAFLATLAIRGRVNPVGKELWLRLLSAASMERYHELDAQNPLSPFLLPMNDGGVLLRPEIACIIESTDYAEALPRLGAQVIFNLSRAPEIHKLISTVGRAGFRAVLDDARTIAFTQVPAPPAADEAARVGLVVRAGSLELKEAAQVKTTWRVLAHIVQLLPTWREHVGDLQLWNQLLSAIVRSRDIDVRLDGAEVLLQDLLRGVRDELRSYPHWSLIWSREAIPGPLISEMLHHDPGIIPEVNAVVFGSENDHLWTADSAGFVHKWNWRLGRGSKFGQEKLQQGEVWSIAVVAGGVVLSASDDGSVAVRSGARVDKHQGRHGAMMNAVVVADGIVVAGDDDSVVHFWRLIIEDDGAPRLVDHKYIGNAEAGWTLACLIVSKNEVYSSHEGGALCRWIREGTSRWKRTSIRLTAGAWVRTLRRDARSGTIFAACGDGKIFKYDPEANSVDLFAEHGASTRGLALVDDEAGTFLATGGDDGVVRLWTAAGNEVSSFGAHRGMIRALDADGSLLASCGTDGFARVWDIGPSVHPPRMEAMDADEMLVHLVAAKASRAFLASTGRETCLVKSLGTAIPLPASGRVISAPNGEIELPTICLGAMLSSDGNSVLASDVGGRIYLFTWNSG